MKAVYNDIERRLEAFRARPLFAFLKDESIALEQRLVIAPYLSFFVMTFADFNRLVIRDEASTDPYQAMINEHSLEDDDHYLYLLHDLEVLGFAEHKGTLPEHIRFLWGEETERSRRLGYALCGVTDGADPRVTLAVIEALEQTGRVFFEHLTPIAKRLRESKGMTLRFFGHVHLDQELGHVANQEEISSSLRSIELTPELREAALAGVERAFEGLCGFMDEAHDYARRRVGAGDRAASA